MTVIEQKALALLGEVSPYKCEKVDHAHHAYLCAALRLSVERHEAAEHELADCKQELADVKQELSDFKQKVSDAVEKQAQTVWDIHCRCGTRHPISFNTLEQFIIPAPKSDPLEDVMEKLGWYNAPTDADDLRAALDALGFEIREKNGG